MPGIEEPHFLRDAGLDHKRGSVGIAQILPGEYSKNRMGIPLNLQQYFHVPSRRLDDRIRELCARAVTADESDFLGVVSDLRSALHEHVVGMRKMAVRQIRSLRQQEGEPCMPTSKPMSESRH